MDHQDLHVVANMYKISVHILTVGVEGMEEPKSKWTHLLPDNRLKNFSNIQPGLLDMWLIHEDGTHFDLMVSRTSILATEGSIHQRGNYTNEETGNISVDEKEIDEYSGENDDSKEETDGPGYMGWKIKDDVEKSTCTNYDELKKAYNELKQDYGTLKEAFKAVTKEIKELSSNGKETHNEDRKLKKLENEMIQLKDDYKQCMQAIKKETEARNKAETISKVLKDTVEAQKQADNFVRKNTIHSEEESMEVDENIGE